MNIPTFTTKHAEYDDRWSRVCNGKETPGEYQQAMMILVQQALDSGLHFTTDVYRYVRERADFIPAEAWDLQYKMAVENGVMGMEIYMARDALREQGYREASAEALKSLELGQILGTLSVNHKRIHKCTIQKIFGYWITFSGKMGTNLVTFETEARHVPNMIAKAVERGWRHV